MPKKSLVIANQNVAVNFYLNLAQTARHVSEVNLRKRTIYTLMISIVLVITSV